MKNKPDPALVKRLIECRRGRGLSQAKFAKTLSVSQGHYSKIERGEAPVSVKIRPLVQQILDEEGAGSPPSTAQLEADTLNAIRASAEFRGLVRAALKMHKKE